MEKIVWKILIGALLVSSRVMANEITESEMRAACNAIIENFDYDSGNSVPLCMKGEWIISDVEMDRSIRQVSFSWSGKVSTFQHSNDKCSGYVLTKTISPRNKSMSVIDLDCI